MIERFGFWKEIAASLPPEVRRRYAKDLEAAERFEPVIDLLIEASGLTKRALGRCCEIVARVLLWAARRLDTAARRLSLLH